MLSTLDKVVRNVTNLFVVSKRLSLQKLTAAVIYESEIENQHFVLLKNIVFGVYSFFARFTVV